MEHKFLLGMDRQLAIGNLLNTWNIGVCTLYVSGHAISTSACKVIFLRWFVKSSSLCCHIL